MAAAIGLLASVDAASAQSATVNTGISDCWGGSCNQPITDTGSLLGAGASGNGSGGQATSGSSGSSSSSGH